MVKVFTYIVTNKPRERRQLILKGPCLDRIVVIVAPKYWTILMECVHIRCFVAVLLSVLFPSFRWTFSKQELRIACAVRWTWWHRTKALTAWSPNNYERVSSLPLTMFGFACFGVEDQFVLNTLEHYVCSTYTLCKAQCWAQSRRTSLDPINTVVKGTASGDEWAQYCDLRHAHLNDFSHCT